MVSTAAIPTRKHGNGSSTTALLEACKGAIALLALLAVLVAGLVFALPRLLGWKVLVVTSGSMTPTIPAGSVVGVKPLHGEGLYPGEVVTFHKGEGTELVTHRIVSVVSTGTGVIFRTKGDANRAEDPGAAKAEAVVGEAAFAVPRLGYVVTKLATPWGAGLSAALVGVALLAPSRKKKPTPAEDAES